MALLKNWPKSLGFDWYLDARMAAEEFQLHIVSREDPKWYDFLVMNEREGDVPS